MPSLAFFPWLEIQAPLILGPLRFFPWTRKNSISPSEFAKAEEISEILAAYANASKGKVSSATLVEFGDWKLGQEPESLLPDIFEVRELIGFSALAERRPFVGGRHYCNFDAFELVVQRYKAGQTDFFSFGTRRRDGGTSHMWANDEFAFRRPHHVDRYASLSVNENLLLSLLKIRRSHPYIMEAIKEFNAANTDSPNVPEHVEVVMFKSAFEWLLSINDKADQFAAAIMRTLENDDAPVPLLSKPWCSKDKKNGNAIEGWAREFAVLRGMSAHGQKRMSGNMVWSRRSHLAFASLIFPLLVKLILAKEDLFGLSDRDRGRRRIINEYLVSDPFNFPADDPDKSHPWQEIETRLIFENFFK